MRLTAAMFLTALTACSGPPSSVNTSPAAIAAAQPVSLTAEDRRHIEAGVRKQLKDPQSAMFGAMRAGESKKEPGSYIVCGWVNSKNSFGGYVGDQPFIAMYVPKLKTALLIGVGGRDSQTYAVRQQCLNEGVPLDT